MGPGSPAGHWESGTAWKVDWKTEATARSSGQWALTTPEEEGYSDLASELSHKEEVT